MIRSAAVAFFSLVLVSSAWAGQAGVPAPELEAVETPSVQIVGPPPPVPPATVSHDSNGRTTVRAIPLRTPLRLDGKLDEPVYSLFPGISDFIQSEPQAGEVAKEKTEVWVTFDQENVNVAIKCWELYPERRVSKEMRRDNQTISSGSDHIVFIFDTFYDHRNEVMFTVNTIGGRIDGQSTGEQTLNRDWNPVWNLAVGEFDGGWTLEAAIPFKSLRYQPGRDQVWGFNVRRISRWDNELSFLTQVPKALGNRAIMLPSLGATLVGLQVPPGARNLEIKPYAVSNVITDRTATPSVLHDLQAKFGGDLKYGITPNMTADVTVNTDFAQVEADEQQINLTRFSLFFPEKREFFLENQGTFGFGGADANSLSGDTPILFYSRRIGLNKNREIPIDVGARVTGRLGSFNLGLLNIQSGKEEITATPSTNFSVVRLKKDILRRSAVGAMFTGRTVGLRGTGTNETYGVDGIFAFFSNLGLNTYWARTQTDGVKGDDTSYRGQLFYGGDRYGVQVEQLAVGKHFNPEMGFVRRSDMRRSFAELRFSPRPRRIRSVRKFVWTGNVTYVENGKGQFDTRDTSGEFAIEFQNTDRFSALYERSQEALRQPFAIVPAVVVPVGSYDYGHLTVGFNFGQQRRMSGNIAADHGTFYDGHKTALTLSSGRANLSSRFSIEPSYSINRVELPQGTFVTHLVGSRVSYATSPQMFASALVQYNSNSHSVGANARLRYEYRPGSELFVVYNEERDTRQPSFPRLTNRSFIVKVNRLFRF